MGFACLMSVLEFIFKGGSLERKVKSLRKFNFLLDKLTTNQGPLMEANRCTYFRKNPHIVANSNLSLLDWKFMIFLQSGVKAKSLVAQALTNTNSNIFNVSVFLLEEVKKNSNKLLPDCRCCQRPPMCSPEARWPSWSRTTPSPPSSPTHHRWGTSALSRCGHQGHQLGQLGVPQILGPWWHRGAKGSIWSHGSTNGIAISQVARLKVLIEAVCGKSDEKILILYFLQPLSSKCGKGAFRLLWTFLKVRKQCQKITWL